MLLRDGSIAGAIASIVQYFIIVTGKNLFIHTFSNTHRQKLHNYKKWINS